MGEELENVGDLAESLGVRDARLHRRGLLKTMELKLTTSK